MHKCASNPMYGMFVKWTLDLIVKPDLNEVLNQQCPSASNMCFLKVFKYGSASNNNNNDFYCKRMPTCS